MVKPLLILSPPSLHKGFSADNDLGERLEQDKVEDHTGYYIAPKPTPDVKRYRAGRKQVITLQNNQH